MGKRKTRLKSSPILAILVIILAILLVSSRTCRSGSQSGAIKQPKAKPDDSSTATHKETDSMHKTSRPTTDILLGKHTPEQQKELLVSVSGSLASRPGMLMHKEAYEAFKKMHQAAADDSIELSIISAFRSFNHQKGIWENKWTGRQVLSGNKYANHIDDPLERALEILRFSAMPGTSRHHWGTDIDINSLNNDYFNSGEGLKEYEWLKENAHKFGFCQPYTVKGESRATGYEEEKWHWSYMPVSSVYLSTFTDSINYTHIRGFQGWENARALDVIRNYVMSINNNCLNFFR